MKKQAIILAALLAANAAQADQQAHAYVGAAAGLSRLGLDCTWATSCDKTDTGGKLYGGYQFSNGFGLEAGYVSFGKGRGSDVMSSSRLKPTALVLAGSFALPLNDQWGMNFRLGAAEVKVKVDRQFAASQATESQTRTKPYAGVGLSYSLSPTVKLDMAVDAIQGQLNNTKGTLSLATVGARFSF